MQFCISFFNTKHTLTQVRKKIAELVLLYLTINLFLNEITRYCINISAEAKAIDLALKCISQHYRDKFVILSVLRFNSHLIIVFLILVET